ncbi:hypothetical protein DPMN_021590 [Dreissena polymorpha]|uniref:Uncharacterized protein n=1 Tax=Dreissena polymorpha TaxID=45954 RepID=A0A9D4NPE9_DREPO|nr:hypothetical protein DPMN_021590 [Dreissena polymorpha]
MCEFRCPFCVKPFLQTAHTKGRSPVCTLMCISSAVPDCSSLEQIWHLCFSAPGVASDTFRGEMKEASENGQ